MTDNSMPPEVEADHAVWVQRAQEHVPFPPKLQEWLDRQKAAAPPRQDGHQNAFARFAAKFLNRPDTPPQQSSWTDPRQELPAGRWRNPRGAA
jgi:hypothetical protein